MVVTNALPREQPRNGARCAALMPLVRRLRTTLQPQLACPRLGDLRGVAVGGDQVEGALGHSEVHLGLLRVLGPKLAQQIEQRPCLGDLPGVAVVDDQVEGAPGPARGAPRCVLTTSELIAALSKT
jgi:hypothetical protein